MKKNYQQSGFSLVELMVVVAIIGILATVAIPRVNKFIAKARTSEAQVNLSSIYTFNKNFYVEFQGYTSDFGTMGYRPEGRLRYNIGWDSNAGVPTNYTASGKSYTASFSNTAAACTSITNAQWPCQVMNGANNQPPPGLASVGAGMAPTMAGDYASFRATAVASLVSGAPNDVWTITESKNLQNNQDGTQ
jgi:type IV pilus assembly protein PilA